MSNASTAMAAGATGNVRVRGVAISPAVDAILRAAAIDGNVVRLGDRLEPRAYAATDRVLKALGGRWDRCAGGHVFARGLGDQLRDALASGRAVDRARTAEQFFTPPAVVERMMGVAKLRGHEHVLEPSAGEGALIAEPLRRGCMVTAVEQDAALIPGLAALIGTYGGGVWKADFLEWRPTAAAPIDAVLMNPPFGRGRDMAHVTRAFGFLRPGGILVAVMSPHWSFAEGTAAVHFRQFVKDWDGGWRDLPKGSFRAAGTEVNAGLLFMRKGRR